MTAKQQALATVEPEPADPTGLVNVIERLAARPDVDVAKLEKIIELQERILAHNAKALFDAAFVHLQADIPEIIESGAIHDRNGRVQSRYAKNEDIQKVLRPILERHGFGLSFRTEWPDKTTVQVVGILTHRDGHSRESHFLSAADSSGSKNAVQALGSAVSYGRRYTTMDLLNITSREHDDDGERGVPTPEPPVGYADWTDDLRAVADAGTTELQAAWKKSKIEYRDYLTKYAPKEWEAIKRHAAKVQA